MAGDAVVGALRVTLGMDTGSYEDGVKNATKATADFGKQVAAIASGIQLQKLFDGLVNAFASGVSSAFMLGNELQKLSQRVGVPVEMLSGLKLAAEVSGISMQQLGDAFVKLGKAATEAAIKPMSQAANVFRSIGLEAKDSQGKIKPTGDLFLEVGDKFSSLKDGADKSTVALHLFGEAGTKLIPLLNKGEDGIQGMIDQAAKLGIVISSQTAKQSEQFNNTLIEMRAILDAVFIKIASGLLPTILQLSEMFRDTAKNADLAKSASDTIGSSLSGLTEIIVGASFAWRRAGAEWSAFYAVLQEPIFEGDVKKKWAEFQDTMKETDRQRATLKAGFESFDPFGTFAAVVIPPVKQLNDGLGEVNTKLLAGRTAFDQFLNSTKQSTAATIADGQAVGALSGFRESLRVVMQGEAVAAANRLTLGEQEKAQLLAVATAAGDAALKLNGINLVFANLDPLVAYQLQLDLTTQAMVKVGATADQIARAQLKVQDQFQVSWNAIGTSIASTAGQLSTLTGVFAKQNKAMGIASKAFAISQIIINTAVAISKANTLPPPANFLAIGLAAATGAAQLATVVAQQGFATGGSFTVGGAGGVDTQLVSFAASPGEMVDVRKPGATGSSEVTVRGFSAKEFFTGDQVARAMVDVLNAAHGDGYKLKFAGM